PLHPRDLSEAQRRNLSAAGKRRTADHHTLSALSAAMVDEFHAIPRLSASGMYRVFACAASHAREWEAYDLRSLYGVPPPETPQEAISGTQRHHLLSSIPFFSAKLGIGKPLKLHQAMQSEASNLQIRFESPPDYWFCYNAILKRNRLITHVIEQLGSANIAKISIR